MLRWLEATALATWTRESPSIWAYPTILTLHTLGLGVVVGASAVVDIRLLGAAKRIPISSLLPLFRIIWWAFALNALTGIVLFMADASTKARQPVFYIKLGLIGLALWNTLVIDRAMRQMGPGSPGAAAGRVAYRAGLSLILWAGAIVAGRLMAYL